MGNIVNSKGTDGEKFVCIAKQGKAIYILTVISVDLFKYST